MGHEGRIARLEILELDGTLLTRVVTDDGRSGVAPANGRVRDTRSLIERRVLPFFLGRDPHDIPQLVELCYATNSNYKYAGVGLWNAIAHVELAVLDLIGTSTGRAVADLLNETRRRDQVAIYVSSTTRSTDPDEELERIVARMAETAAGACKFKIGGRMSGDEEANPRRTERLIGAARRRLGSDAHIYVDANSSYQPQAAIEIGRRLEASGIDLFEEPVHFEDFEGIKRVADELDIAVSGGEQNTSEYLFRWMIEHRAVDVIQPDVYYAGGLIRTLRIAREAETAGIPVTPHSPRTDFQQTPTLHLISLLDHPGPFHEHHIEPAPRHGWVAPEPEPAGGSVSVPVGPGLGLEYDQAALDQATVWLRRDS